MNRIASKRTSKVLVLGIGVVMRLKNGIAEVWWGIL